MTEIRPESSCPQGSAQPGQLSQQGLGSTQHHHTIVQEQADGSDEGRLAGTEMVDRATSGRPVLSGPAELGLHSAPEQQLVAAPAKPNQLDGPVGGKLSWSGALETDL